MGVDEDNSISHGEIMIPEGSDVIMIAQNGLSTIDGAHNLGRALHVPESATLELAHVTFQNFISEKDDGAAVYNAGTLTTYRAQFTNCNGKRGGAIYNRGTLNLRHYLFTTNLASDDGSDVYNEGSFYVEPYPFTGMLGGEEEFRYSMHSSLNNDVKKQQETQSADDDMYDITIHVNHYVDDNDGDCTQFSATCNLRAAINLASTTGKTTMIILPTQESHYITQGEISVSSKTNVKLTSSMGLAMVDGSGNQKTRFLKVEKEGYVELVHLIVSGFTSDDGGAILNNGELVTYRTEFASNTSPRAGAIHNNGVTSLWYSTFTDNKGELASDIENAGSFYVMPCAPENGESIDAKGIATVCYDMKDPAKV